ncbi:MAG: diguanylate cyclase [Tenericutes bacterium]|nr:diguanylate cyclase [Mycoplasmatota bacterium]
MERETQILYLNRDIVVNEIESELTRVETIINNLDSYITSHDTQDDLELYISKIVEDNPFIASIYFVMPNNTYITFPDQPVPPGVVLTDRPWYTKAASEVTVVFTDAFLDVSGDKYILTAAKAVIESDILEGVIGIDIDLEQLSGFLANDVTSFEGYAFIIDSQDNLIAYVDYDPLQTELETLDDFSITRDIFTESQGLSEKVTIQGELGQIAYSEIEGTDFLFGLFMSTDQFLSSLNFFYSIGLSIVLVILFGSLTVYFVYLRLLQRPLDSLIVDIDNIDKEKSYDYRFPIEKGLWFNKAREALNKVLDDTQKFKAQANSSLSELTLRNQKYNLLLDSASDIVFQIDKDRKYVEIYGKGLKQLKKTEKDFLGNTFEEVFGSAISFDREECYDVVFMGSKRFYTWEYVVDKNVIYFETAMTLLYDLQNEIIGAVGVTRDITEQELRYQDMVTISNHDYLTGLRNRRYYIERLQILDTLKEYPFGVMNIDVNGLKIINDAYGHSIGDEALIKTANVLREASEENYIVSRVSGDEFTIILPNSDTAKTKELKEDLLNRFKSVKISNLDLSVAIGFHVKEDDSKEIDEVRMLAENDMFRHKVSERRSVKNKAISAILKTLTEKYEAERIHSKIVAEYSKKLGEALGLEAEEIRDLTTAAMFHDIGKISIPDNIINKPGKLDDREYEIMKTHTEVGYEILRAADEYSELAIHASSHHEKWNGKGYPKGLKGEKIPYFSRIICIADAYEAMTADRPYRKKQSDEFAASEIIKFAGIQFDPVLAKVFVEKVLKKPWPKK